MNLIKVEGIVIGETNYSESSKILRVLTDEYGIISVMSKGCRNLKSKLRGVSSQMTYGMFNIYYKENGISTLVSVDVLNCFRNIMLDIEKISYSSYLLELAEQVSKHSLDKNPFKYLKQTLIKINENYDSRVLTNIFELKMLDFLGIRPVIDSCCVCGTTKNIITISPSMGGYICSNCQQNEKIYQDKTIKLIRMLYYVDIEKITKLEIHDNVKKELDEFIDLYYDNFSGLYLKSKKFLKNINKIS